MVGLPPQPTDNELNNRGLFFDPLKDKRERDTLNGRLEDGAVTYTDCACCGRYMWSQYSGPKNPVCAEACGGPKESQVGDTDTYPHSFAERWCRRGFK
jgi:hypothetical protein